MNKIIIQFTSTISLLMLAVFSIHVFCLNLLSEPLFANKIIESYLINHLLTIAIFITLIKLKDKFAESLGYFFFVGSGLKFLVFFIVIYPFFKENGDISRLEFTSFFIPYAIALIFEVIFMIKILNK